jgi:hypothetical protein
MLINKIARGASDPEVEELRFAEPGFAELGFEVVTHF